MEEHKRQSEGIDGALPLETCLGIPVEGKRRHTNAGELCKRPRRAIERLGDEATQFGINNKISAIIQAHIKFALFRRGDGFLDVVCRLRFSQLDV